ncbi:hypothetical protein HUG17_10355 [Dermatophagoides farinae]|uniref:Uncharacterized protein n=1 Tax=Dermatophagoides farinae TaxID=6954 RepID=A0A9D4SCT7_DERFA|nr:hypothetical protein HUG17_10355 [Dermatophagoides farinae]
MIAKNTMAHDDDDHDDEIPIPFEEIVPIFPDDSEIINCGPNIPIIFQQLMSDYSSLRNNNNTHHHDDNQTINVQHLNTMIGQCRRIADQSRYRLQIYHNRLSQLSWHNFTTRFRWLVAIANCQQNECKASWLGAILLAYREQFFIHLPNPESIYSHSIMTMMMMNDPSNEYFQTFLSIGLKIDKFLHSSSSSFNSSNNSSSSSSSNRLIILRDLDRLQQTIVNELFNQQHGHIIKQITIQQILQFEIQSKFLQSLQLLIDEYKANIQRQQQQQQRIEH